MFFSHSPWTFRNDFLCFDCYWCQCFVPTQLTFAFGHSAELQLARRDAFLGRSGQSLTRRANNAWVCACVCESERGSQRERGIMFVCFLLSSPVDAHGYSFVLSVDREFVSCFAHVMPTVRPHPNRNSFNSRNTHRNSTQQLRSVATSQCRILFQKLLFCLPPFP